MIVGRRRGRIPTPSHSAVKARCALRCHPADEPVASLTVKLARVAAFVFVVLWASVGATKVLAAARPDFTGHWSIVDHCTGGGCTGRDFFLEEDLVQRGGKLTGTGGYVVDGSVSGASARFTATGYGGYVATFKVTMSSDGKTLKGTATDTQGQSFTITGQRAGAAPVTPGSAPSPDADKTTVRLCIGGCRRTSVITPKSLAPGATKLELTATCGDAKASGARASQLEAVSCPVAAEVKGTKGTLTELQKIQEAEAKTLTERHQIMKGLQTEMFDATEDVFGRDERSRPPLKNAKTYFEYIRANAGSPDVVATLEDADSGLAGTFPPQATAASAALRARAAQTGGPDASAVLNSMYMPRPTRADAKAYNDTLALATSSVASLDRGRARLMLSVAIIVGRRALLHDLGATTTFTIAAGGARVPAGRERPLSLKTTALGGRALRVLGVTGLSKKVSVTLRAGSRSRTASRTINVR